MFLFLTALWGRKYQRNLASVFQPLRGALFQNEAQKVECSLEFVQSVEVVYVSVDRYIAMITKQKAFNKSLVDQKTQVIFMDEAHVKLLDPDDCKVLTQGGLTAHDRKYRSSSQQEIRCPMFITCQTEMDFGEEHNAAMDARLRKFYFKSLNSRPVPGVTVTVQWIVLCGQAKSRALQMMSFPLQCPDQLQSQMNWMTARRIESKR